MRYFSDLMIENEKLFDKNQEFMKELEKIHGVKVEELQLDENIKLTRIIVTNKSGSDFLNRPIGIYITMEIKEEQEPIDDEVSLALSLELKKYIEGKTFLIVGIGNADIPSDSLGPSTLKTINPTGHLFSQLNSFAEDGEFNTEIAGLSKVYAITTGVMGVTGLETWKQVEAVAAAVNPDTVILVDSLAAKNIERIGTTIQFSTSGLVPGGGNIQGHGAEQHWTKGRKIDENFLKCKVITIGVPTLIDYRNIVIDALEELEIDDKLVDIYLEKEKKKFLVTSSDIDQIIKKFSKIIGNGINITLNPDIYF